MSSLAPAIRARKLLDRIGFSGGILGLTDVCDVLGIDVRYKDDIGNFEAFLTIDRDNDRALIIVNNSKPYHRQRFSLAHEIGHTVLGHGPIAFMDEISRRRIPWQEVHANRFAAELLMPQIYLRSFGKALSARFISEACGVSEMAAEIRLQQLGWV